MVIKIKYLVSKTLLCIFLFRFVNGLREKVPCIDNGKFYRNPNRDAATIWATTECAKYYLCIENEIFSFTCSTGLNFDVNRQICDFKVLRKYQSFIIFTLKFNATMYFRYFLISR